MARWADVVSAAPELATRVQALFDASRHKTIATLRRDGSPRISGIEASFRDGDLWFGSMWQAVKALDLRRDPRFALHSPTGENVDPATWPGDAKISGRAEEITDPERAAAIRAGLGEDGQPEEPSHLFRGDMSEVVLTRLGGDPPDHLVIELWTETRGLQRFERR